jgi:hypothetical protein
MNALVHKNRLTVEADVNCELRVYTEPQEERSILWKVIVQVILSLLSIPTPSSFRDRVISPYSSKIVEKKEILRTVSNKKFRFLVRQRTIPTERPPLVGEVSANFSG